MLYFWLWAIGFSLLWAGLRFDDEVLLIVSVMVGAAFVLWGLVSAPLPLQLIVETACVVSVFLVCMRCIERGTK